ncbi:hypothetical protein HO173_012204 [Letharia columbiana]|uniref:Uncharacterized protein n=1 Tax=Letharia columbiana TaxID=112416 RepID=A0A8H6CPN1_9LECA|nr:uncharacterized protein HO173_012204 [Letharia columbiana]KAF6227565.1 hypothetical protein HO173_012204 [Letharia columbiana]
MDNSNVVEEIEAFDLILPPKSHHIQDGFFPADSQDQSDQGGADWPWDVPVQETGDDAIYVSNGVFSLCATSLAILRAGDDYDVQLAYAPAEWPNHVWWWTSGTKGELIQEAGNRGSEGPVPLTIKSEEQIFAVKRGGMRNFVRVDRVKSPVLRVWG